MNSHIEHGTIDTSVSRRRFVQGAAGLTFAFTFGGAFVSKVSRAFAAEAAELNAWVTIGTDNTVKILCPTAEMGQGVLTSLPLILAEELDADWSTVKTDFAPANPKIYGNPHELFQGAQITAASVSIPGFYMPLRLAGAQARKVLIDNVAEQWKVPAAELTTDRSTVIHQKSRRRISYGEIVKFAKVR